MQKRNQNAVAKRKRINLHVGEIKMVEKGHITRDHHFLPSFDIILLRGLEHSSRQAVGSILHDVCRQWANNHSIRGFASPIFQSKIIRCTANDELDAWRKITNAIALWVEHGDKRVPE